MKAPDTLRLQHGQAFAVEILVAQFRSLTGPIIILLSRRASQASSALLLWGTTLNVMSLMVVVMLQVA